MPGSDETTPRSAPEANDTSGVPKVDPLTARKRRPVLKALRVIGFLALAGAVAGGVLLLAGNYIVMPLLTWRPTSVVPDLYGTDLAVAKRSLLEADLVFINDSVDFVHDPFVPTNHVVSQDPAPYSRVKTGRRVRVVISRGPQLFPVPEVTSTTPRDARLRLLQQGFRLGRVTYQLGGGGTDQVGSDIQVSAQDPQTGSLLARGDSVGIHVNIPPFMPDLRRRSLGEALQVIELMGLRRGQSSYAEAPQLLPLSIVEQSIPPGQRISRGERVDLVLSSM